MSEADDGLGSGFHLYMITDEQLKKLQEFPDDRLSTVITEIEGQHLGLARGFVPGPAITARPVIINRYLELLQSAVNAGSTDPEVNGTEPTSDEVEPTRY